jgi:hypothetical protein
LLGATRDPRAALALGESVENGRLSPPEMFDARDAARRQLLNFVPMPRCGEIDQYPTGLQGRGEGYQEEWFRENKARLQKLCANLPRAGS